MFGLMGIGAGFINAAGRGGKKKANYVVFQGSTADPTLGKISCTGEITVESIKNGETVIEHYTNLNDSPLSIQADANTDIMIKGDVTKLHICYDNNAKGGAVKAVTVTGYQNLTSIDMTHCLSVTEYSSDVNNGLQELDLSQNVNLTFVDVTFCQGLTQLILPNSNSLLDLRIDDVRITSLDLSINTNLTHLSGYFQTLTLIKYPATNQDVSGTIASLIGAATGEGTVYTDSNGAYYSTIETAAQAEGWTIEQL